MSASLFANGNTLDQPPSEEQHAYFSELLAYGVDRLAREPDVLRAEQDSLARQVQETSITNYRSFTTTAQCLESLQSQLQEVVSSLDALSSDLPALQTAADAFRREGAKANTRRESIRQLYAAHPTLVELLEIPSLMDTCIRNGNFDEALDLRAYTNKLAVMHGNLPLVQRLVEDVSTASQHMMEQLLSKLSGAVQLPECLRVIGYLRRLSAFSEGDLRLAFLQHREAWIASITVDLDERSAYELLKRLTDVYRLHVFDVVMQYRAVFSENSGTDPSATSTSTILPACSQRRIAAYLDAIQTHLPRVTDGGSLASVLDHIMYCGASLGRVGLDFRPAVAPMFESAALGLFIRGIEASDEALKGLLETHKWVVSLSSTAFRASLPTNDGADGDEGADIKPPPASLVEHPPLAVYTNGLLAALNELRHCAPLAVKDSTAQALQASLLGAASAMNAVLQARSLNEQEMSVHKAACAALSTVLCPYIVGCFDRVYPGGLRLVQVQQAVNSALKKGGHEP